jgi:hypothetical protein
LNRDGEPWYALSLAMFTDKHSWTHKQSGQSVIISFLNLQRSVANMACMRFIMAELDGTVKACIAVYTK